MRLRLRVARCIGMARVVGDAVVVAPSPERVRVSLTAGVGVVWFTTDANHHHNRRNDYKKIGDSLATDF